jgi:hypothetical protein
MRPALVISKMDGPVITSSETLREFAIQSAYIPLNGWGFGCPPDGPG